MTPQHDHEEKPVGPNARHAVRRPAVPPSRDATAQSSPVDVRLLQPRDVVSLQKAVGNRSVAMLLAPAAYVGGPGPVTARGEVPGLLAKPGTRRPARGRPPEAPMIPVRLRVQRFNPGKDDARKPTKDLKHPAVVNIGIAKLGPYEFHPMQGTFVYHAPKAPAATGKSVGEFLQTLSNDKKGMPLYEPEDRKFAKAAGYLWTNPALKTNKGMPIKIHFYPGGVTPARPAERAIKATQAYLTEKVGFKAGAKVDQRVPGKIYDALASVNAGKVPRQFVSIVNEDALGAAGNAHNQARHVLGGVDMPDLDAVAVRAAFGLIGGLGGHGAMYSPTSSAFKTVADADIDVGNAINNHLAPQWKKYRIKILIDGGVTLKVPRVGGQIVAFSSVGGKWAKKDVPTYLDPMSPGQKPLFYPDGRYDAWARPPLWKRLMHYLPLVGGGGGGLDAKQYNALKAQPLTQDASAGLPNVNVRIVSSDAPNTKGWFINSAYPCK